MGSLPDPTGNGVNSYWGYDPGQHAERAETSHAPIRPASDLCAGQIAILRQALSACKGAGPD